MKGRRVARPEAEQQVRLEPHKVNCQYCGEWMPVAYHAKRKILTVNGLIQLRLVVRRCHNPGCQAYKQPYRLGSKKADGPYRMENVGWI